jgi:hypothetical protein
MAELSGLRTSSARRRVVMVAVIALAAGAVAGGVAVAANGHAGLASSPVGGGSVATAAVVRTTLANTVQVGGSIGYDGSYTVSAPSGSSAAEVSQQQQAVDGDRMQLSADEQTESDAVRADGQTVTADAANVSSDQSALTAAEAAEKKACAGAGASSQSCDQDAAQVSSDQTALTQAKQQLAQARSTEKLDRDENQAKVAGDQAKLAEDQASLASLQADAVNPGTTFTWLPQTGQVIKEDQSVYAVSNVPVPLLYGPVPAYRPFEVGMSDGPDVAELTRDLIALGYGEGLSEGDHYSSATAAAVQRWQRALGLPVTGQILLGEAVFEPGPIRVTSVTPSPGATVGSGGGATGAGGGASGGGTVLTATSTTPVVTVDLGVSQEYLVRPGDAVSVVLPNGTTTAGGKVQTVGTVATCPSGGSTGTASGGSSGGGSSPCSSLGTGGSAGTNSSPTVPVTITLDSAPAGAALDQAPVNVNITTQQVANVLAVPVNALLALAGGGYGVDVVSGTKTKLVGVTTGMYAGSMVQVSGPGITAGERVQVPAQ